MATYSIDITERIKTMRALEQSEKLQSIGKLTGGIAHDFNNILTGFVCYLDMLAYTNLDDKQNEIVETLNSLTNKATTLVSQLLGFSRQQNINVFTTKLSSLTEDSVKLLKRVIPEDINFSYSNNLTNEPLVKIDTTQFSQILLNLVINAIDAIRESGKSTKEINIILDRCSENEKYTFLEDVDLKKFIKFSIIDSGTGIKQEIIDKIFDPFFTTKMPGKGTGLGLASVYGIVKQNGGYIFADSKEGEYTRLDILWPVSESKVEIETKQNQIDIYKNKGNDTILLVEDNVNLLKIIGELLEKVGYRVFIASNGEEGLEIIIRKEIDVVVTDLIMPKMSADKMLEEACKLNKKFKAVIIMTGYADEKNRLDILKGKLNYHLVFKPFSPAFIAKLIRESLG
jgi:two-component system cell cycle sensor histidine kinase/response regulator CckA